MDNSQSNGQIRHDGLVVNRPLAKLRVCHLITQLELGGAQQNTLYTIDHLNAARFEPSLVCGSGGLLDDETQHKPWATNFLKPLVRSIHPIKDVLALVALYRLLRKQSPMILHTHSSKAGILGRLAGYFAGVPIIIHTFHGFGFTPDQPRWLFNLYLGFEKLCAKMSTHLIFVAEDNKGEAQLVGLGSDRSQSVIRSGITMTANQRADIRRELGLASDAWLVVSVGNFKPQKNPLDLIRVAQRVCAVEPNAHFVLVGDGPLRPEALALAQTLGVADHVHFLGWRRDAAAITAAANAFLLTSLWEGLPRALVEAIAQHVPSVAYAVNGVKDLLVPGVTGFPVEPHQWGVAAEKIIWLKAHAMESRLMANAAYARVREEFNIDRMVKDQESLYVDLYDRVPLKEAYGLPTL